MAVYEKGQRRAVGWFARLAQRTEEGQIQTREMNDERAQVTVERAVVAGEPAALPEPTRDWFS